MTSSAIAMPSIYSDSDESGSSPYSSSTYGYDSSSSNDGEGKGNDATLAATSRTPFSARIVSVSRFGGTSFFIPRMIVFDKDGTLGNDRESLRRWANEMTSKTRKHIVSRNSTTTSKVHVQQHSQIEDSIAKIHHAIGWDAVNEELLPSALLAAGTWEEVLAVFAKAIESVCRNSGTCDDVAEDEQKIVRDWHKEIGNLHSQDEPVINDLPGLILECKQYGLRVAVCTSDDRKSTNLALSRWGVDGLVDYSICGDEVANGKPSADPLNILCRRARVTEGECIVVGDTTADSGMAKNAGAGLMIGVLSGSGGRDQLLSTGADLVLSDVGRIPSFIGNELGMWKKVGKRRQTEKSVTAMDDSVDFSDDWIVDVAVDTGDIPEVGLA